MSRSAAGTRRPGNGRGASNGRGGRGNTARGDDGDLDDWLAARATAVRTERAPAKVAKDDVVEEPAAPTSKEPAATTSTAAPEAAVDRKAAGTSAGGYPKAASKADGLDRISDAREAPASKESKGFRTDTQISSNGQGTMAADRDLRRWEGLRAWGEDQDDKDDGGLEGTLEDFIPEDSRHWDQFERNKKWFGVETTFKDDLSQYTTPLDLTQVPAEAQKRAARIARELGDRTASVVHDQGEDYRDDGWGDQQWDPDADEEDLFSTARPAKSSGKKEKSAPQPQSQGQALLAALMQPSGGTGGGAKPRDRRTLLCDQLQVVSKRCGLDTGKDVITCPFSHQQFGEMNELVAFWKDAMPREAGEASLKGKTSCNSLTEYIWRHCFPLKWGGFEDSADLGRELREREESEGQSLWKAVVDKIAAKGVLRECSVGEVMDTFFKIRVWQRSLRVEHLELLELFTMCCGLHLLRNDEVTKSLG